MKQLTAPLGILLILSGVQWIAAQQIRNGPAMPSAVLLPPDPTGPADPAADCLAFRNNRQSWSNLARRGNPLLLLNAQRYSGSQPAFQPPAKTGSAWMYYGVANELASMAYAAGDPRSPLRGRVDLVNYCIGGINWLLSECDPQGAWWSPQRNLAGDPNINRFVLVPLLDATRWIGMTPAGPKLWARWKEPLAQTIELQRRAYRGEIAWDGGAKAGGFYPNQDVSFALALALSARLYDRVDDAQWAADMIQNIGDNLLPDGAIRYIGAENDAPQYHTLNLLMLARYAEITGDKVSRDILRKTANYWPLVCSAEGQAEYWSSPWWKQDQWRIEPADSFIIAAGATQDARNQWLMWRVLERQKPVDHQIAGIYAASFWPGLAGGEPIPGQYTVLDKNMRGARGRNGHWYYGVLQGRGLRNVFAGGMLTQSMGEPIAAAFGGAEIHVLQPSLDEQGLWLSQMQDKTSLAIQPDGAMALSACYSLQPTRINNHPSPQTPDSPWRVIQSWRASADGITGMVLLEAGQGASGTAIVGRVSFGPGQLVADVDGNWHLKGLKVRLYDHFGEAVIKPAPNHKGWCVLEFGRNVSTITPGDRFTYSLWVGPESATPPARIESLPKDMGWIAQGGGRRAYGVLLNPTNQAVSDVSLMENTRAWLGEDGQLTQATPEGKIDLTLAPWQCALLEK
ncbi:MAG: hypothetical protein IT446_13660 [Phycisphaerales bacterium]|nr:hypothetical protein [Phycisphaerales bacterium]